MFDPQLSMTYTHGSELGFTFVFMTCLYFSSRLAVSSLFDLIQFITMRGKHILFGFTFKDTICHYRTSHSPPMPHGSIPKARSRSNLVRPLTVLHSKHFYMTGTRKLIFILNSISNTSKKCRSVSYRSQPVSSFHSCRSLSYEMHKDNEIESRPTQDLSSLEDISGRIILKDDNIVAVNKPYGLSVYGSSQATSKANTEQQTWSLTDMIHRLKEEQECPELNVGLSLKSFYSGVVLLTKDKNSKEKLDKFLAMTGPQKLQFMTYLAITVGVPQCPHGVQMEANIKREFLHNREMSIVCDKSISSARKEGAMMQTVFSVKPVLFNKETGAALVEISVNKDRWEAVEVLMSHYLSPVLGDYIYSSRTHTLMGVPFAASPYSAIPGRQRLPLPIQKAFSSSGIMPEENSLPLCVHRYKVTLSKFPSKGSNPLIIKALPDGLFLNNLKSLGLYNENMFSI